MGSCGAAFDRALASDTLVRPIARMPVAPLVPVERRSGPRLQCARAASRVPRARQLPRAPAVDQVIEAGPSLAMGGTFTWPRTGDVAQGDPMASVRC